MRNAITTEKAHFLKVLGDTLQHLPIRKRDELFQAFDKYENYISETQRVGEPDYPTHGELKQIFEVIAMSLGNWVSRESG